MNIENDAPKGRSSGEIAGIRHSLATNCIVLQSQRGRKKKVLWVSVLNGVRLAQFMAFEVKN